MITYPNLGHAFYPSSQWSTGIGSIQQYVLADLLKQGSTLKSFLDVGAADILLKIKDMEGYRRVLSSMEIPRTDPPLKLLCEGKVDEFTPSEKSVLLHVYG